MFTSQDLEDAGVSLENQHYVLEKLTYRFNVITYSFEWPNRDKKSLPKSLTKQIENEAPRSYYNPKYQIYKILSQRNFIVEVLPQLQELDNRIKANLPLFSDEAFLEARKNVRYSAMVTLHGNQLAITLRPGLRAPLGPPLKYGMAPYNFMHYLFLHPFQTINIHDVRENVEGCSTTTDLTEMVRYCHFNKFMKKIFFERTTKTQVRFTPWRDLKAHEIHQYFDAVQNLNSK